MQGGLKPLLLKAKVDGCKPAGHSVDRVQVSLAKLTKSTLWPMPDKEAKTVLAFLIFGGCHEKWDQNDTVKRGRFSLVKYYCNRCSVVAWRSESQFEYAAGFCHTSFTSGYLQGQAVRRDRPDPTCAEKSCAIELAVMVQRVSTCIADSRQLRNKCPASKRCLSETKAYAPTLGRADTPPKIRPRRCASLGARLWRASSRRGPG